MGGLSGADQAQWEEDGWCLVRGLLPPEAIAAAQAVLPTLVPTAEEFADDVDPARNEPFRVDSHRVMPRFPFEDGALNDIVVHDRIIDLAEQLLGLTDLRLYQAMLSAKYAEAALSDEQLLHVDFGNHTLVVPRHEPGYQQLEMFVYLSDVTPETGGDPDGLTSADLPHPGGADLPQPDRVRRPLRRGGPGLGSGRFHPGLSPRRVPPGRAHDGAALGAVHAARLVQAGRHRLVGVTRSAERRRGPVVVPVRAARHRASAHRAGISRRRVIRTGPPQTLAGVAARYPMLDLSPWRDAAAGVGSKA